MADGYISFDSQVIPVASITVDPTSIIKLTDPVLYTAATFFQQLLQTNLQPRFSREAVAVGLTHASLDNWVDDEIVSQTTAFPLNSLTLQGNDFKFPHLNAVVEHEEPFQFSLTNSGIQRDLAISWLLPPLSVRQYNRLYHFLSQASKVWIAYGQQGYDPKVNKVNVWATCNASFGSLNSVDFDNFRGLDKDGNLEVHFPAIIFRLSVFERQQLPVPNNYTIPINSFSIDINLVDGYSPANPINFIDGYVYPNIYLSSCNPSSGSIQGGTTVLLTGQGFFSNKLSDQSSITIAGAPVSVWEIKTDNLIQLLTPPGIIGTSGQTGAIVLTDNLGYTYNLSNCYTYTGT